MHAAIPPGGVKRYTSAMKLAVPFRHRRLLALCACSAAIHLVLLAWFAGERAGAPAPPPAGAEELVLRLAPERPARVAAAEAPQEPASRPAPAPQRAAASASRVPTASAPRAADAALAAPGVAAPAAELPEAPSPALPGRYRVRLPASAQLSYTRTLERPGTAPVDAGPARLDWQTDGQHYSLHLDGVSGTVASEGERGDTGLLPLRARQDGGNGEEGVEFDHQGGRVRFTKGAEAPAALGIQDRASMLLQLAGIGLAVPDQVDGTIALVVAAGGRATVVRWQLVGSEELATALGRLDTRHLAEVAAPGRPRLEVWLAPSQDWLPVRLRQVYPDGSVATQTLVAVTRMQAEAAAPASLP